MEPKLDAKFYGPIFKVKDDSRVPQDQWVVFLAKDTLFAEMFLDPMNGYLARCARAGCDKEQIEAVKGLEWRIATWRADNKELLKIPDAKGEKLLPSGL